MESSKFDQLFDNFTEQSFRLETLPQYNMGDLEGVEHFLSGDYLPQRPYPGVSFTQEMVRNQRRTSLMRALRQPLTPHERYCLEWVYPHHAEAGRDIMLLPAQSKVGNEAIEMGDYWLFDSAIVARMHYDNTGRFQEAEVLTDPEAVHGYVEFQQRLVRAAVPFREWLTRWRRQTI